MAINPSNLVSIPNWNICTIYLTSSVCYMFLYCYSWIITIARGATQVFIYNYKQKSCFSIVHVLVALRATLFFNVFIWNKQVICGVKARKTDTIWLVYHWQLHFYSSTEIMVSSKAAIYSWFKGAVSSQRIEMMCSIFQLCLPNEIRFIAACLEDKARKDYALLREYETKSNEPSEYSAMTVVDLLDDTLQKRLIMYTSLLRSSNSVCANNLFQILTHLYEKLLFSHSQHKSRLTEILTDRQLAEDLILLFTLSAHHPAYVFSQRLRLFEMLIEVKRLLKSSGLIVSVYFNFLLIKFHQIHTELINIAIRRSELNSLLIVSLLFY